MSLLLRYLVQTILISWTLDLKQYVFPNYISRITDYLMYFGGSPHSGATTNQCLFPSYVFVVRQYFGAPFIGIINFGAPLSVCDINIHSCFIGFSFQVIIYGSPLPWSFPQRNWHSLSVCCQGAYYTRSYMLVTPLYYDRWDDVLWNNPWDYIFLVS